VRECSSTAGTGERIVLGMSQVIGIKGFCTENVGTGRSGAVHTSTVDSHGRSAAGDAYLRRSHATALDADDLKMRNMDEEEYDPYGERVDEWIQETEQDEEDEDE